ncbi:MAG: hypothetical protein ABSD49_04980 [Candidatus Bathyarchaeia archaeon]|jgi:hypothetical protein
MRESVQYEAHQNSASNDALTKLKWKNWVEAVIVDRDSVLSIVEHVRTEVQVSRNLSVTMWAALAGAVIGSIFTIIGTYFLSLLPKLFAGNMTAHAGIILTSLSVYLLVSIQG